MDNSLETPVAAGLAESCPPPATATAPAEESLAEPGVIPTDGVPAAATQSLEEAATAEETAAPLTRDGATADNQRDGPDPTPTAGADQQSAELLRQIAARLQSLEEAVAEANRLGRERERIVDRLHEENQRLKAGELQQAMTPVWRDLIRLYDDLAQSALAGGSELGFFKEVVADLLYRHAELEPYGADPPTAFNPREHRALATVPTADPELDRTLARVARVGFRNHERVFRPLEAEVFRFKAEEAK